ncbi:hypothetical protein Pcinc_036597 [Petrolisthes cinctipes]|uniref:Endonuclease/exonuclease/phosphatase domain-containing protein n=1 Tax=Petrolisthes cinctipes TaxID=88211 RepID=A0AAE1ENI4_PETCI|nr:hypothetical protein Pcinc_036597 [Petrolisthes cinctipes]
MPTSGTRRHQGHCERDLKIVSANVRGFHTNVGELTHRFVQANKANIVFVCETFLDNNVTSGYARIKGYSSWVRKDRSTLGGGVALCFKNSLRVVVLDTPIPADLEVIIWKVCGDKDVGILCVGCYRPPSQGTALIDYLLTNLDRLMTDHHCNFVIILGDLNQRGIQHSCDSLLAVFNLQNYVTFPTHRSGSSIDPVVTDLPSHEIQCSSMGSVGSSDHEAILTKITFKRPRDESIPRTLWQWESADWCKLRNSLEQTDWESVLQDPTRAPSSLPVVAGGRLTSFSLSEAEVRDSLSALKEGKAVGPEGVSPRVLRRFSTELTSPLTKLFRAILHHNRWPRLWKTSHVIPVHKKGSSAKAYADDVTVSVSFAPGDETSTISRLNTILHLLEIWGQRWQVSFAPNKTQLLVVSRTRHDIRLFFDGAFLTPSRELKILGVTYDDKLTFKPHIMQLARTAAGQLASLQRISWLLDNRRRELLYKAQIRSSLEYSCLAWGGAAPSHISVLDKVQRRAERIIWDGQQRQPGALQCLQHRRDVAGLTTFFKAQVRRTPHLNQLRQAERTPYRGAYQDCGCRAWCPGFASFPLHSPRKTIHTSVHKIMELPTCIRQLPKQSYLYYGRAAEV